MRLPACVVLCVALFTGNACAHAADTYTVTAQDEHRFEQLGIADLRRATIADAPAARWETGFLSGNGQTGAIVMGRPQAETIILNRAGLFLPYTPERPAPNQGAHLAEIRQMMAEGQYQKAADFIYELSQKEGYNGTHWIEPFVPACSLQIRIPDRGDARDYLRGTDYPTGVVGSRWTDAHGTLVQRVFVSRADDVVVVSLRPADGAAVIDADLAFVHHDPSVSESHETVPTAAFRQVESRATADAGLSFHASFANVWPGSTQGCEAAARIVATGGTTTANGSTVAVRGAKEILVLVRVAVIYDEARRDATALTRSLAALPSDYDALLARHAPLHGAMFNRTRLSLDGDAADHRLPAQALFAKSTLDQPLPALLEKQFDACRYLILSSSGPEFPPTLQGIWGGTFSPAWSSGYTSDGNLPVAVVGSLPANLPETLQGFFALHRRHLAAYRENARRLFAARGIVVPPHQSSHGSANHFGPKWCLTFWSAGAGWAAHTFYDYYLYTGDRTFLREQAIPFMKETALFYEDLLAGSEDAHGLVHFSPSYSPENEPANTGSQACVDATMDIAVCRETLRNLIAACRLEGIEPEGIARWTALLGKLPPYRINADGALAEWTTPALADNYAHRHVSHLYELYDGLPDSIGNDPRLMEAFRVALQKRTDWRRATGGGEMAFGQVQMGAVAANLRNPALAYENLGMLSNWYWFTESMMTAHNPHTIFNTDIAGGIPQLVIQMLVGSQPGWIELLPALPTQWPSGSIEGVLCRGQVEIRRLVWEPGKVTVTLRSQIDQTVDLRTHGGTTHHEVRLPAGQDITRTIPL